MARVTGGGFTPASPQAAPRTALRDDGRASARTIGFFLVAVAFALTAAPLASLLILAMQGDGGHWSHLLSFVLVPSLTQTLLLLAGVAAGTTVIGVGAAWAVTTFDFPGRNMLVWLLPLPLAVPTYIAAYIYVDLLDPLGPVDVLMGRLGGVNTAALGSIRSLPGAIFVFSVVLYPYVFLATRAAFQTQSAFFADAARVVGAGAIQRARHITLPLARPAVAVGLSLTLMETLNDIGASEYLGLNTITLAIFTTWLNRGSLPGAAQIACVMLVIVAGLIVLERQGRRQRRYANPVQQARRASRVMLRGKGGLALSALCFLPVVLGLIIPVGLLVHITITRGLIGALDADLMRHTASTVTYAAAATVIVLVLGFGSVLVGRVVRSRAIGLGTTFAGLGYAVPGTVLALGLLAPLVVIDDAINLVTETLAGVSVGLVVAGSGAAIVIAYVVRFLAVGIGFAQAGMARIPRDFDDSARMCGADWAVITRSVHVPLAAPALWGAALLIFVDCLKELPASLLLRPLNVETLSTYIYQFAMRGTFEAGSLAALMIVAVGILPVTRLARYADAVIESAPPAT